MEKDALEELLETCGDEIIDIYRKKLAQNKVNATGSLGNNLSCFVQIEGDIFELCISIQDYWKYIENGRKEGKFPNLNALIKWIQAKPILPRPYRGKLPSTETLAFLIGRKIQKDGIAPKPMLAETLEEIDKMQLIEQGIDASIRKDISITFNKLK